MQYELTPPDRDHEGKMARADLFKLAQYSFKLFKMMEDEQQLDGWVQAKITKAADYIASVYHYLEYEMKFSDYGQRLENSDVYTESIRDVYASKLMEAKKKMDKLKAAMEKKDRVEEGFADLDKYMKDKEKSKGTGKFDKKKISTGTVYTKKSEKDIDDEEDTPKSKKVKESFPTVADAKARHEKEKGTGKFDKKKISTGTVYTRKADKDIDDEEDTPKKNKKVKEGAKPDFLDMDKDGNKKEPMKKAAKDAKKKAPVKEGAAPYAPVYLQHLKQQFGDKKVLDRSDKYKIADIIKKSSIEHLKQLALANIPHVSNAAKNYIKHKTPGGMVNYKEAEVQAPNHELSDLSRKASSIAQIIKRKINSGEQMDDRDYNQMAELGAVLSRVGASFGPKSMKDVMNHMIQYTNDRNDEGHDYPEFTVDRFKELIAMAK